MEETTTNLEKQSKDGQIIRKKLNIFMRLGQVIGGFVLYISTQIKTRYNKIILLSLNDMSVNDIIKVLNGDLNGLKRVYLPISDKLLHQKSDEYINLTFEKLKIDTNSANDILQEQIQNQTLQLIFLNQVRFILLKKIEYGFEFDIDCKDYLKRYNLNIDDENFSYKLMNIIKRLESDLKRNVDKIEELKKDDNKTDSSIFIKRILFVLGQNLNQTVNGKIKLYDFFIMYDIFKEQQKELIKLNDRKNGN